MEEKLEFGGFLKIVFVVGNLPDWGSSSFLLLGCELKAVLP